MTSIKPRTASIVIYQGDDLATLNDLRKAAEASVRRQEGAPSRLGDDRGPTPEQEAYDAFVGEAADRAVVVEFRAIGRKRFAELVAAHPARKVEVEFTDADGNVRKTLDTHPDDAGFDVNVETFGEALLMFVDKDDTDVRTIVEPEFKTTAERQDFLDNDLSEGNFVELWTGAYYLNRAQSVDPKASLYGRRSTAS